MEQTMMKPRPVSKSFLSTVRTEGTGLPSRVILHGTEGIGKCLGRGTPVLKYDGSVVAVEEVAEGELLAGPDGQPRKVTGVCSGTGPLFRIIPTKGDPFVVTGNHVLPLKISGGRRHGQVIAITAESWSSRSNAFKRDHLLWRAPAPSWPASDLPIPPYILGIWLADGTSSKPEITTPDQEVVEELQSFADGLGEGFRLREAVVAGKAITYSIRRERGIGNNRFTQDLDAIGVLNNKHIPRQYMVASKDQRLELLAGLLDGDGSLLSGCFEITSKYEAMARQIVFVARSLGLAAYVSPCSKTCTNGSNGPSEGLYWRVIISGDIDTVPCRVERKKASPRGQRKSVLVTGYTVEPIGDGEFFGFEVDGDHLFMLGDFTVTHNSSFGAHAPNPIFLQSRGETGLETLIDAGLVPQTPHFPEMQSWEDALAALVELRNEEHQFKTLVIDTLNGLEKLLHEYILRTHFAGDIVKFDAYGRGAKVSFVEWRRLFTVLDEIRTRRRMGIIALCHTRIKTFKNPDGDDYDRYSVDMHEESWGIAHKWADMVLFANYVVAIDSSGNRAKGKGGRQRVIYTTRAAAHDAKNRNNLPETIAMGSNGSESWTNFKAAVVAGKAAAAKRQSLSDGSADEPKEETAETETAA